MHQYTKIMEDWQLPIHQDIASVSSRRLKSHRPSVRTAAKLYKTISTLNRYGNG